MATGTRTTDDSELAFVDKAHALSKVIKACSYCGAFMGEFNGDECLECGEEYAVVNLEEAIDLIIDLRMKIEMLGGTELKSFDDSYDDPEEVYFEE